MSQFSNQYHSAQILPPEKAAVKRQKRDSGNSLVIKQKVWKIGEVFHSFLL